MKLSYVKQLLYSLIIKFAKIIKFTKTMVRYRIKYTNFKSHHKFYELRIINTLASSSLNTRCILFFSWHIISNFLSHKFILMIKINS